MAGRLVAPKRGALIVFEGIDRSGKSSQAKLLYERLVKDGVKAKLIRFPDRTTPVGQLINGALSGASQPPAQVLHLLFAANRWELQPNMIKWLNEGFVLVVDRYSFSGVAYSTTAANVLAEKMAASAGHFPPVPISPTFARATEEGLTAPDRVFFLDIKPEETKDRKGYGEEVYEAFGLQQRVYSAYETFRSLPFWHVMPASGVSVEDLHETIITEVDKLFRELQEQQETAAQRATLWDN